MTFKQDIKTALIDEFLEFPSNWPVLSRSDIPRTSTTGRKVTVPFADTLEVGKVAESVRHERKHGSRGSQWYLNYHIPITSSLVLPKNFLAVPAYLLGVLLHSYAGGMKLKTTMEFYEHYRAAFVAAGYDLVLKEEVHPQAGRFAFVYPSIIGMEYDLERIGFKKLIPDHYLRASEADRYALLVGLLDQWNYRGNFRKERPEVAFETSNAVLAEQVADLVRGLGHPAYVSEWEYKGDDPNALIVSWHPRANPYKHPKNRTRFAHLTYRAGNQLERYVWKIYSCEPSGRRIVRDLSVESPYGLFSSSKLYLPLKGDN